MNKYIAKRDMYFTETIQEHTDKLIYNLQIFRNLYPDLDINWLLLEVACKYHDLGKMNLKFQNRIEYNQKCDDEIAHNLLSLAFLDKHELRKHFTDNEIIILAHAIAYHHERGNYQADNYKEEVEMLKKEAINFKYDKISITKTKKIGSQFFNNERIYSNDKNFYDYVKVKGLLNKLDYAASSNIQVEYENDFLCDCLNDLDYEDWNDLQYFMKDNQDSNIVVSAQTGMGKTEAGLLWIGDNKGFFTLPIKTAINEIYKRIVKNIIRTQDKQLVGLLHSDTYSKYIENKDDDEDVNKYYNKTKQLSLPLTICTLDQLFDIVFLYKGFEHKLVTLSYSKIVIDEIQMYSADLLSYLIIGLSYITRFGGKFAILTATLPSMIIDFLKNENIEFIEHKPFINNDFIRHSIKVVNSYINSKLIVEKFNDNKILVICNTIKQAQEIYNQLTNNEQLTKKCTNINLFHSRFTKHDRKSKEVDIFNFGQKTCKDSGIWITTQIVEASLDIDFDLLFTELSDINGLFQRLGRCYRNRLFNDNGYNCYVFNGGRHTCSGVGYFIDEKIFKFSKEIINDIDGIITEQQKIDIINHIYSTENLKDTDYYKDILNNINYIKSFNGCELDKKEVNKRFRSIDNVTIMPECIYIKNKIHIDNLIRSIKIENDREKKRIIIDELMGFTIDVYPNELNKKQKRIMITNYHELLIYDGFEYDYKNGLVKL